jgi:hypothetical protein
LKHLVVIVAKPRLVIETSRIAAMSFSTVFLGSRPMLIDAIDDP